jgi:hypothetical protein
VVLEVTTIDKGQGRLEKRTIRVTTLLTKRQDWKGLKQGFELERERTINGVTTKDTAHGITSLPTDQASPSDCWN